MDVFSFDTPSFENNIFFERQRKKREFTCSMLAEFDLFNEPEQEQNNFDWSHLKKFYNNRKTDLGSSFCILQIFCEFAFKLFVKFNCQDYELMLKIIRMHYLVLNNYSKLDSRKYYSRSYNYLSKHYYNENVVDARSVLKKVNKLEADIFAFSNRQFYGLLVVGAVHVGSDAYLKFLVKYGLSYSLHDASCQVKNHLETLFSAYVSLNPQIGPDTLQERNCFADSVFKRLLTDKENTNLTRINLIILAVSISLRKGMGDLLYPNYAKCWHLYALTLPEATICIKEVKDLLDLIFVNDETFKDNIISLFKEVFPEISNVSSPRSLKYLCRCSVRYYIKTIPSLETVLSEMQIPNTVKDYVLNVS